MNKQVQTQIKNHLLRKSIIDNQRMDEQIQELLMHNGAKQSKPLTNVTEDVMTAPGLAEVPGPLIDTKILVAPFDEGTTLDTKKANTPPGTPDIYATIAEAQKDVGELNLSTVIGKWFDADYLVPTTIISSLRVTNMTCCHLSKMITINPFAWDVFVKATTVAILPDNPETVYFLDRGSVQTAGVQGVLRTALTYPIHGGDAVSAYTEDVFLQSVQSAQMDSPSHYSPITLTTCILKLPAGTTEFVYHTTAIGSAFMSNDINNADAPAIALLDLRNVARDRNLQIFLDPLLFSYKQPAGGMKFIVKFEFYKAVPIQIPGRRILPETNL